MPKTTNKGIRFSEEELQRAEALLKQFPEYRTEAELLHQAAVIGLLVLATQAIRPGQPPYAGYRADDLAALLKYRLMPTIDFLIEQNALPITFQRPAGREAERGTQTSGGSTESTQIAPDAAEGLDDLGTSFMDDR